jgi:hypothetical protein
VRLAAWVTSFVKAALDEGHAVVATGRRPEEVTQSLRDM